MPTQSDAKSGNQVAPAVALRELIGGFRATQLIYVAAKLGIADLLKHGPKTSDELAESVGAQPHALYRVLRALAGLGIFEEGRDGRFDLTPLAEPLRTGVPGSLRAWAVINGGEWQRSWGDLMYSVRTGRPAFDNVYGMGFWEYHDKNPETAESFNEGMSEIAERVLAGVVEAYDFSGATTAVDVGGGHGSLIAAILKANPHLRGVLFDKPAVVESARAAIEARGLAGRCELVAGDFFESVPGGADLHLLKWIIHDWDDDRAIMVLRSCRHALAGNGKLLVVERVIPPGNEPSEGKLGDIMMLVLMGGLERTEAEYRALFAKAGFTLTRIVPTASPFSVIEGVPA